MLGEIVTRLIDEQEDMATVSSPVSEERLLDQLAILEPKVVLIYCAHAEACAKARTILERKPHVRVIALTADGREAAMYELRPHHEPLGAVSSETLIRSIREVVRC
jgi:DNA-binding NarL/FixJ family response regulator